MSDQSDLYFPNESPDAKYEDLFEVFFAPSPQPHDAPSPESFDQDVDRDVAELDLNWSFDDLLSTVYDNVPAASTLPSLTYSTDTDYEIASSQDFDDNAPSVLLFPSEIETCGLMNDGPYTTYDSTIDPAVLFGGLPPFPPANAQSDYGAPYGSTSIPVHVSDSEVVQIKAQSDYGTSDVSTSIPVHVPDYEAAQVKAQFDHKTPGVSTSPPVHVPDSEAVQTAKDKPFKCTEPECLYTCARKNNLKTHIKTHFGIKEFGCNICGSWLTRKNDLKRHLEKIHGETMSSASESESNVSNHRFDPMSGRPQYRSSINRDKRLT